MTKLTFLPVDHPILKNRCVEIPIDQILSPENQSLIDEMLAIAKGERTDLEKRVMVGLAAPQIGIPKRIILVDLGVDATRRNLGKLHPYINPRIIWQSEEMEIGREGCFSTDSRLHGIVPRSTKVRVAAYDREGNFLVEEHREFTARIFQHEIDHLEGIRFPDRMGPNGKLLWVEEEEYKNYRDNWQDWTKTYSFQDWVQMRGPLSHGLKGEN
jgi:peptide deformylase